MKDKTTRYNASFTVGALLVPETRLICKHLLKHKDGDIWEDIIYRENILQQRSPKSAQRIGGLIRQRLLEVGPEIHKFIAEGDLELATQATLVATIKQNRLLGDFMRTVLQDHFRTYQPTLEKREWNKFIGELELSAEDVKSWSERTKRDLGIRVYKALIEAGYLSDTKKLLLQRVTIRPEILSYLDTCNEDYVRECMDVC